MKLIKSFKTTLILVALCFTTSVFSYTMPVGIPDTGFDFEREIPERPVDWSAPIDGYYFIDYTNGSNSNVLGTPTEPRRNIPSILPEGAYVEIKGDYPHSTGTSAYNITAQGTETNPVFITSAPDGSGRFTHAGTQLKGSWLFLTDMNFYGAAGIQISSQSPGFDWYADHIVIRNNTFYGDGLGKTPVTITGDSSKVTSENIVVYNNRMSHGGDMYDLDDQDTTGVQVAYGNNRVWILENVIHEMSGAGVQVLGSDAFTSNTYVGRNEVYRVRQSGLWVKRGNGVVFSENYVHNVIATQWSVSKCMGAQYEPHNLWMINNVMHDCTYGVRIGSTTGGMPWDMVINVIGNVIYNIAPQKRMDGTVDAWSSENETWQSAAIGTAIDANIFNNVIYDVSAGVTVMAHAAKVTMKNNVIYKTDYMREEQPVKIGPTFLSEGQRMDSGLLDFDNNVFDLDMNVRKTGTSYTLADMEANGSTGNISAARLFTKAELLAAISSKSIADLNIASLRDAGTDTGTFLTTDFTEYFSNTQGIDRDMFNMVRIQETGIDIGPWEQGGTFVPVEPSKPSGLYVDVLGNTIHWLSSSNDASVSLWKDGVNVSGTLPPLTSSYAMAGVADSINSYYVIATNTVGTSKSPTIKSSVIDVVPVVGDLDFDLDSTKSWILPRVAKSSEVGGITFNNLSFSGDVFGIPNTKTEYTLDGSTLTSGYIYQKGVANRSISGRVTGTGTSSIVTMESNYSGVPTETEIKINDSVVLLDNSGGFKQNFVTFDSVGSSDFSIRSVTDNTKSAFGISAIVEQ